MGCGSSQISSKNSLKTKTVSNFIVLRSKAIFASKVIFIIKETSPETEVSRIKEFD